MIDRPTFYTVQTTDRHIRIIYLLLDLVHRWATPDRWITVHRNRSPSSLFLFILVHLLLHRAIVHDLSILKQKHEHEGVHRRGGRSVHALVHAGSRSFAAARCYLPSGVQARATRTRARTRTRCTIYQTYMVHGSFCPRASPLNIVHLEHL